MKILKFAGILFINGKVTVSQSVPEVSIIHFLVGFIYILMRRRNDVSNRSVSLAHQLQHPGDVSACSTVS